MKMNIEWATIIDPHVNKTEAQLVPGSVQLYSAVVYIEVQAI